jgi:hypothetical protein
MTSVAQFIEHRMIWWLLNSEGERMWKEVIVAYLEVLSRYFTAEAEENRDKNSQDRLFSNPDFNPPVE